MNLHDILFTMFVSISTLIFVLFFWTLYEFMKLGKEQFRNYIFGLAMICVGILFCIFRYIIFPPLSNFEKTIFGYGMNVLPAVFMFYLLCGTEKLARIENSRFIRNETLYGVVLYMFIILCVYQTIFISISFVPANLYEILDIWSNVLYIMFLVLLLKLFLEYKKAFMPPFDKIIYHYVLAIIFLAVGGILIGDSLLPIVTDEKTFTDLSYLRNIIAVIGAMITLIPASICFKSVAKFRRLLKG